MTGWIAGDQGKILKTTTGGLTYVSQSSNLVPNNYFLYQNYPNPFNPSTNIKFEIPSSLYVTIKVYSVLGREVATLINEFLNEGSYQIEFNGSNLESGIYFYRIQAGDFTEEKSMIMLK
ncbi:MAG: T9SS type A sorting domain-containing protein [Ignavibacteria bacterium]|nr:T9SS type A sorting domain-containing protein [Ignavibacteria bacterium]